MKPAVRIYASLIVACSVAPLVAGCTHHTYYGDEGAPPGRYELKDSSPISRERVVERHYVVE